MKKVISLIIVSLVLTGCWCHQGKHSKHHGVDKMHHEHGDK